MKRTEVKLLIDRLEIDKEVIIKTRNLSFALKKVQLFNDEIILFGGYGKVIYWIDSGEFDSKAIVQDMENYLSSYRSDAIGGVWIKFDECEIAEGKLK